MTSRASAPAKPQTPWYAPGLAFSCTQCGNCCTGPTGYVWFNAEESKAIADYLGMDRDDFEGRYSRLLRGKRSLTELQVQPGQFDCVFLTRDGETGRTGCSIYPVRPTQCRTWPFWPDNLRSPRHWDQAAQNCPGMKQGGDFVPIEQIRLRLASNPLGL